MESVLGNMNPVLQMLTVMTMFSLLPFVFCCMTCFLRFTIVFSLLKTAMGVQVPPSIVTIGLCMILTFYTMGGVFEKMYERGSIPYQKNGNLIMLPRLLFNKACALAELGRREEAKTSLHRAVVIFETIRMDDIAQKITAWCRERYQIEI